MDIKQLRYFLAVYQNGSIAKAANKVYISQQGLSMALLRLESELSCRLLERTPNGMVLTPEGEYLLPRAEKLVEEFDEIEEYFSKPVSHRPAVKVACALGAIPEWLAALLSSFRRSHPQYNVIVDEVSDTECDSLIETQKADLGFGLSPLNETLFDYTPVFSSPFCLLVNKCNALADLSSVSVDVLRPLSIMVMNERSKTNRILCQCCGSRGFQPEIRYSAAEVISIHRMVASNVDAVGITVLSVAKDLAHPDVVAIPFEEPEMVWELNVFKLKHLSLSPGARALEAYISHRLAKPPVS
jgi:DNA-binding transcriptional LysR family regulator